MNNRKKWKENVDGGFIKGRAEKAASLALSNIYSFKNYKDCKILLLTFSGGESLGLLEINDAAQLIEENYGDDETYYLLWYLMKVKVSALTI